MLLIDAADRSAMLSQLFKVSREFSVQAYPGKGENLLIRPGFAAGDSDVVTAQGPKMARPSGHVIEPSVRFWRPIVVIRKCSP